MDDREAEAATRAIRSGWVTQGPEVERFEQLFADAVGAPHACACSSGTAALHLALLAAGVTPGDEVITVSHSFIATASAIRYCGALPVFVDVDPATFNIDVARIEGVISPRTRAILCVHQMGMPCDLAAITALATRRGLMVIEDAACAAGSEILLGNRWEHIGRPHGDICCFSFHPRKVLTTGDGGMVTTRDPAMDRRMRQLRQHGMNVPAHVRHTTRTVQFESYDELGFNYRLTDIQAAIGQVQVERLPAIVAERRRQAARYADLLVTSDVMAPVEPAWARSNWQTYCVWLPDDVAQQEVMAAMRDRGVATRAAVMCAHREPAYPPGTWSCGAPDGSCDHTAGSCVRLAISERARDRAIQLPLFPGLTDAEQARVVAVLGEALDAARQTADPVPAGVHDQ
jgi:perosamine synthetase